MNEKEFVFWLDGFVTACNKHMPTPAQWDTLVDVLSNVRDRVNHSKVVVGQSTTLPLGTTISTSGGHIVGYTKMPPDNVTLTSNVDYRYTNDGTIEVKKEKKQLND